MRTHLKDARKRGWYMFPVGYDPDTGENKMPLVKWRDWIIPKGRAKKLFTLWENSDNVTGHGIDCGRSGLVVLDEDGADVLREMFGDLPATYTVKTGKGQHLYYLAHPEHHIRNLDSRKTGAALDVRADGGYVVGAGSLHISGVVYEVADSRDPVQLPDDVAEHLAGLCSTHVPEVDGAVTLTDETTDEGAALLADAVEKVRTAPVGARNQTLNDETFRVYGLVKAGQIEHHEAADALRDAAAEAGLGSTETEKTLTSAATAAQPSWAYRPVPPVEEMFKDETGGDASFREASALAEASRWLDWGTLGVPKPVPYLCGELLIENAANIIYGAPSSGKSLATLVLIGEFLADHPDAHVVLVFPEDGPNDLLTRMYANDLEHLTTSGRLHVLQDIGRSDDPTTALMGIIAEGLRSGQFGADKVMVVVDNVARLFTNGMNTNDYAAIYALFGAQAQACLAQSRLTFLSMWHTNRSGSFMGSNGLQGSVRNMVECSRSSTGMRTLEVVKRNNGGMASRVFDVTERALPFPGNPTGPHLRWLMKTADPIVEALRAQSGPMTATELAQATGRAPSGRFRSDVLGELCRKGQIVKEGKRGKAVLYRLPNQLELNEQPELNEQSEESR